MKSFGVFFDGSLLGGRLVCGWLLWLWILVYDKVIWDFIDFDFEFSLDIMVCDIFGFGFFGVIEDVFLIV